MAVDQDIKVEDSDRGRDRSRSRSREPRRDRSKDRRDRSRDKDRSSASENLKSRMPLLKSSAEGRKSDHYDNRRDEVSLQSILQFAIFADAAHLISAAPQIPLTLSSSLVVSYSQISSSIVH